MRACVCTCARACFLERMHAFVHSCVRACVRVRVRVSPLSRLQLASLHKIKLNVRYISILYSILKMSNRLRLYLGRYNIALYCLCSGVTDAESAATTERAFAE